MIRTEFEWHPHTEKPQIDTASAIIAIPAEAEFDSPCLLGIFEFKNGEWQGTAWSLPLPNGPFYWALEVDVIATIPSEVA